MSFKQHLKTTKTENDFKGDIDKVLDKHQVDSEYLHKVFPLENDSDTTKD